MLKTRFTEMLGLQYPVMSAPMSNHSGGRLAAAVCQAGGLGTFGGSNNFRAEWFSEQIGFIRSQTDQPFGVGFITHLIESNPSNFEAALAEKVRVIIFSFADPRPWLPRARDAGATTICQVQTPRAAELALDAGADILLAQGNEAGGHTGEMNLLPLLVDLVERYPDFPVLAAGGITSGRALAGVLTAGADGASLGTALLATPEAVEVPDAFKEQVLRSEGQDTTYTRLYDLLGEEPWPDSIAGRVYRNRLVQDWDGRDAEILARREELATDVAAARARHDPEVASVYMGQGVAQVNAIRPAGEKLRQICHDAESILAGLAIIESKEA
ncbi:MAG: nitronate monooxygenase [Chloroflexota bacterium]|nr:nitronate monooxygenase [Chloroflexota bacterium]MDE2683883.1 nitronate monooxygenase [Chloroflexota bacterium]